MKKFFIAIGIILAIAFVCMWRVASAAPIVQYFVNIAPFLDNTYDDGDSTHVWKNTWTNILHIPALADGCLYVLSGTVLSNVTNPTCTGGGSGGGTWATTTSNVTGQLINYPLNATDIVTIGSSATTSAEFYFDPNLQYSFLTGTTTISKALQIGGTAGDNALKIFASRVYPSSNSTGGLINFDNSANTGSGLVGYTTQGSSAASLASLRVNNVSFAHSALALPYLGAGDALSIPCLDPCSNAISASNTGVDHTITATYTGTTADKGAANFTSTNTAGSVLQVAGAPASLGLGKFNFNGVGDAGSSIASFDASAAGYLGQGLFIDCTGGSCDPFNKAFNVANSAGANSAFTVMWSGKVGVGTSSPYAPLSVVGEIVSSYFNATSSTATSNVANIFSVGNNTTAGLRLNTPLVDLYIDMDDGSNGNVLTTTILGNSTNGTGGSWSISPTPLTAFTASTSAEVAVPPVQIGSTIYNPDAGTLGWGYNHAAGGVEYAQYTFSPRRAGVSMGAYFSSTLTGTSGNSHDNFLFNAFPSGASCVFQSLNSSAGQSWRAHSAGGGLTSAIGQNITYVPGKTYWVTMRVEADVCSLMVIDPVTWTKVGESLVPYLKSSYTIDNFQMGAGHAFAQSGVDRWDDMIVDYTNDKYPLLPEEVSPMSFNPNTNVSYMSGPVGIGTTSPFTNLAVEGAGGIYASRFRGYSTFLESYFLGPMGFGTTTPQHALTSFSATAPQFSLSAGAGLPQWAFRNAGGNLYLSTTTVAGTATTTTAAFSILNTGESIIRGIFQMFNAAGTKIMDITGSIVTLLGAWDFGGATSVELPNSTSPSLDAAGEIALDTTSNNLVMATSTTGHFVVASATTTLYSFTASTSPLTSGTNIDVPSHPLQQVATSIWCKVSSGTSIVINLSDGTNDTNAITCTTTGTQYALTSNNTFTSYEAIRMEVGTKTGDTGYLAARVMGYRVSD